MYTWPGLAALVGSLRVLPALSLASGRMTGLTGSRSHTWCAMYCECHLYSRVFRLTAIIELVYRLSPGRIAPYRSGDGLPATKKTMRVSRSTAGVIHTPPPRV